jgi:hypothetical protein
MAISSSPPISRLHIDKYRHGTGIKYRHRESDMFRLKKSGSAEGRHMQVLSSAAIAIEMKA